MNIASWFSLIISTTVFAACYIGGINKNARALFAPAASAVESVTRLKGNESNVANSIISRPRNGIYRLPNRRYYELNAKLIKKRRVQRYEDYKARNLCVACGQVPPQKKQLKCATCSVRHSKVYSRARKQRVVDKTELAYEKIEQSLICVTESDWMYMAGIVDGEGCVYIRAHGRREFFTPVITLQVSNTNRILVDWLKSTFGGGVYGMAYPQTANRKPAFNWTVSGRRAITILGHLKHRLKLKSRQAEIAIEMAQITEASRRVLSPERHMQHETLLKEIRALNKKGKV